MHTIQLRAAALLLLLISLAWTPSLRADLKHRYSFDESPGSGVAGDFYSGANGTLLGGADFTGTGAATFNGTSAYIDLPNGLVSVLSNATFEAWISWNGAAAAWQRVFDFGNSITGEDTAGTGSNYIFLTARSGAGTTRFGARSAEMTGDNLTLDGPLPPTNVIAHLAVSYDFSNSLARLFINGAYVSSTVATQALNSIADVNNWLGRSQFSGDAFFGGLMHEFRIYDNALSAPAIAANAAAGPDNDSAVPGGLVSVSVTAAAAVNLRGSQQARIFATFASAANVNVTSGEGATWATTDAGVATVDASGVIRGVSLGSAIITGTYQGQSAQVTVSVIPIFNPRLKHRYAFGEAPGSTTVIDGLSAANGTLVNGGNSVFTGSTLILSNAANTASSAVGAHVDLPNGIIRVLTNATFETWVRFVPVAGAWQRIFDFGETAVEGVPNAGLSYIFLNPRTGTTGGTRFGFKPNTGAENLTLNSAQLPNNAWSHVVVTYHPGINVSRMYINGAPVSSGAAVSPLSTINDINNWLGRAQFAGDTYFNGVYDEFRIYEGAMSEGDVAASFVAGPNVTNATAGELQSVNLVLQPTMRGGAQAAVVLANYQNVSGVDITASPLTTFSSSNPARATINSAGVMQALAEGSVTISAAHNGVTNSRVVTITGGALCQVVNRYSFNETGGSAVSDSVGGKHGTILTPGNALFTGGRLRLNNSGSNVDTNSYVDLPNYLVRSRTNMTIEMWVTWENNFTANWQRFFDFGSITSGAEGVEGTGFHYLLMTPRSGATGNRFRTTVTTNSGTGERIIDAGFTFPQNVETHVVLTYNSGDKGTNAAASVWVNGTNVNAIGTGIPLSAFNDVNNWLGRAQYNDPYFNGSYNELRIYEGAMTPAEINASRVAGPDAVLQPALNITATGGNVLVSWPVSPLAFALESAGTLGGGEPWSPAGGTLSTASGTNTVTLPLSATNLFFRLKK